MGKWAKQYFETLKKQEGEDFNRRQANALERQHVLAKAPIMWDEMVNLIFEEVDDLQSMRPGHLTLKDERQASPPKVRISTLYRHLELSFKSDVPQIKYHIWEPRSSPLTGATEILIGEFEPQVHDQEVLLFSKTGFREPRGLFTVPDAVDQLLQRFGPTP